MRLMSPKFRLVAAEPADQRSRRQQFSNPSLQIVTAVLKKGLEDMVQTVIHMLADVVDE